MPLSVLLPPHLAVRAPTRDDLPAIFALIQASDLDIYGRTDYTLQELQHDWSRPEFNPATDAWIVTLPDGSLVGYAQTFDRDHYLILGMGVAHPSHEGMGIGSTLLNLMEERAREHIPLAPPEAQVQLQPGVGGGHEPSARLMTDHGYTQVRSFTRMGITLDAPPSSPVWPAAITVRTLVPGQDERALYEAMEESFSDHWGHSAETFEHWMARHNTPDSLPPDLVFLAMADETVAGAAICINLDDFGWVDTLGVRRPWRKQGLGLALLRQAFDAFYRRGRHEVGLGVDAQSLTGATRLYERAGMHPVVQYDVYRKVLRPGVEMIVESLDEQ
ncbi:MAG TPA: GNAT family N-acetyltransferase [Ktedonobacterales bacterium]|jgi:GNAT superfamily N-acetyltransferase